MKRLLYLIALLLALVTAVGYVVGKDWQMAQVSKAEVLSEAEILRLLKQKGKKGDAEALYKVGVHYEVRETDYFEAQRWYRAAALRGDHSGAQYKLGRMYINGRGVENDLAVAMDWFRKSARQGDPRGYFFLGVAARDGWERKADPITAYKWLWLARTGHDVLMAENRRYNPKLMLEELEVNMSQFSIEKARKLAAEHPVLKIN